MGKTDEALDLHIRMLELPDIDELRESQVKSLTQAIRIWLKKDPPQYKPAIDRGNGMLVKMAPAERGFAYWQALSLETAKAYLMQADALQKENAGASKISAAKKKHDACWSQPRK